jgi:hypothetical protein
MSSKKSSIRNHPKNIQTKNVPRLYHVGNVQHPAAQLHDKIKEIIQKFVDDENAPGHVKNLAVEDIETGFADLTIRLVEDWDDLWKDLAGNAALNRSRILKFDAVHLSKKSVKTIPNHNHS